MDKFMMARGGREWKKGMGCGEALKTIVILVSGIGRERMGMECIFIRMGIGMKGSLRMGWKKEMGVRSIRMVMFILASLKEANQMVKELYTIEMELCMWVIL